MSKSLKAIERELEAATQLAADMLERAKRQASIVPEWQKLGWDPPLIVRGKNNVDKLKQPLLWRAVQAGLDATRDTLTPVEPARIRLRAVGENPYERGSFWTAFEILKHAGDAGVSMAELEFKLQALKIQNSDTVARRTFARAPSMGWAENYIAPRMDVKTTLKEESA